MNESSVRWKFFAGSCLLVAALLVKAGAPIVPVASGMALAGIITWKLQRRANRPSR
jgi:hypothetical protein